MTNIINFESRLKDRTSDTFLNSLNRMHDAKISGAMSPDELSKILVLGGNLLANKIVQGKISQDEIESAETIITGFLGKNRDNYFSNKHVDLDKAARIILEGNFVALEKLERKNKFTQSMFEEEDYEDYNKGFRKAA